MTCGAEQDDDAVEEVDADDKPPMENPDDPDNIVNLMMQAQAEEDDEIKMLFMDTNVIEQECKRLTV